MTETPAPAGYSGTPLLKKLGLKPGQRALLIGVPEEVAEIGRYDLFAACARVSGLADKRLTAALAKAPFDYVHIFAKQADRLADALPRLGPALDPAGMIWVSWPKKASKVATDITEDVVRNLALSNELVDIKVCAVDHVWSGLKLVIPVALRAKR